MTEQTYSKVFELIEETLVPKAQLEEAEIKIKHLEAMVEKTTTELEKVKSESIEQKLSMEIIQAEKDSLQAEKESLQVEKKVLEVRFKEVSLKLKQKTNQCDSLRKSQADHEQNNIVATGSQTIKQEHEGIGIVNVPASTSSKENEPTTQKATPGIKRKNASKENSPKPKTKRKKVVKSTTASRITRQSSQSKPTFTCRRCFHLWGNDIESSRFKCDPDKNGVPDPKQKIPTFKSFEDYKSHLINDHDWYDDLVMDWFHNPNSNFVCETCNSRFEKQWILDEHQQLEHMDLNLSNQQFYELYNN